MFSRVCFSLFLRVHLLFYALQMTRVGKFSLSVSFCYVQNQYTETTLLYNRHMNASLRQSIFGMSAQTEHPTTHFYTLSTGVYFSVPTTA